MVNVQKLCTVLIINTIHKHFFSFNRYKMINMENGELHNEATGIMTDAAASAQTDHGYHDVLRIREDSGTVDSREKGGQNTDWFATERSRCKRKLVLKLKNIINLCISYKLKFVKCTQGLLHV
jgi:hypothetical protein